MKPYREYDFEMWCRKQAEQAGDSHDSGLYWFYYRRRRHEYEATLRERERMTRARSDLEEMFEMEGLAEIS